MHKHTSSLYHIAIISFTSFTQAITSPSQETEAAAWEAVVPAVDQLKDFYEYSNELGIVHFFHSFLFTRSCLI